MPEPAATAGQACRDKPVVVASATRSGSTLLQRILNTHPDVTIWGEHMGILAPFGRAMTATESSSRNLANGYRQHMNLIGKLVDAEPFSPHINPFDADELKRRMREFIQQLFADPLSENTTWGFKEVRYFGETLEFFVSLFPSARFIILAREPKEQLSSYLRAPWHPEPELATAEGVEQLRQRAARVTRNWTRRYESFKRFVERHREASITVTFEQLTDPRAIADVFSHIGCSAPQDGSVEAVIRRQTGSSDRSKAWTPDDRAVLDRIIAETPFPDGHDDVVEFFFKVPRAVEER